MFQDVIGGSEEGSYRVLSNLNWAGFHLAIADAVRILFTMNSPVSPRSDVSCARLPYSCETSESRICGISK